jgi:hypothetical protein
MRLYRFTFEHHPSGETLSVFYLAKNDWEFLRDCIGWAHDVSAPEETLQEVVRDIGTQDDVTKVAQWYEDVAAYNQSYATALREKGFDMEPKGRCSWESWESTEEEIALLRRFHAINE